MRYIYKIHFREGVLRIVKILVVYYSFEGSTRLIAQKIAEQTGAELLELKPKKDLSSRGFMKYVWGGRQATMKEKPELMPLDKDPLDYELIYLGTPVWAFTYAPAIRSFLADVKLTKKKMALFCCCDGGAGKTMNLLQQELSANEILGELVLTLVSRKPDENLEKTVAWVQQIQSKI